MVNTTSLRHFPALATLLLLLLLTGALAVTYDVSKYCTVVPAFTRLPDLAACQSYHYCVLQGDTKYDCFNDKYFDKDAQQCRPSAEVKCYAHPQQLPCQWTDAQLVENPNDCQGFIKCENEREVERGTCPQGEKFNAAQQSCSEGSCSNLNVIEVANICEALPDRLMFGDFEQCNIWHKCENGTLASGTCEEGMIFNIEKASCSPIDKYDKSCIRFRKHETCDFPGVFHNDPYICSVFSYCWGNYEDRFGCGGQDYYEASTGFCVNRQMATPSADCNRCEYATTQWVNAVDQDCRKYLVCREGVPYAEGSCGVNSYFDEQRQSCVVGLKNLEEYRKLNGACRIPKSSGYRS